MKTDYTFPWYGSVPLACYLYADQIVTSNKTLIEQGRFMKDPSPSVLYASLEVEEELINKLYAGGEVYLEHQIEVELSNL